MHFQKQPTFVWVWVPNVTQHYTALVSWDYFIGKKIVVDGICGLHVKKFVSYPLQPHPSHWHQWFPQWNQQFCDAELPLWDELRECISPFSIFTFGWKAQRSSSVSLPETQERKFGKGIKNNFSKSHSIVSHLLVLNSLLHTVSDCCALSALWLQHQPKPWASVTSEEQEVPLQINSEACRNTELQALSSFYGRKVTESVDSILRSSPVSVPTLSHLSLLCRPSRCCQHEARLKYQTDGCF